MFFLSFCPFVLLSFLSILFFFKLMEEEINYFFAALGLGCSCGSSLVVLTGGHPLALHGLLVVLASPVVEHRL